MKKTSVERIATEDKIVTVETVVTVEERHIDYNDILESVEVVADDYGESPLDNCDGFEHELVKHTYHDHEDRDKYANNQVYVDRSRYYINLKDDNGLFRYYRERGASRQVAAELVAADKRRRIEYIKEIYENGYEAWGIKGEYNGYEASVWGVDDYDYAERDVRHEVAAEIVYQLEKDDYIVTNKPDRAAEYRQNRLYHIRMNANMFNTCGR